MSRSVQIALLCLLASEACQPVMAQERATSISGWVTDSDFSDWAAKHKGEDVIVRFAVTQEGRATNCKPLFASKSEFSSRVCDLIVERGRYVPAYDRSGSPIVSEDQLDISWRSGKAIVGETDFGGAMPANNPSTWAVTTDGLPSKLKRARPGALDINLTFTIGSDGRVSGCRGSSPDAPEMVPPTCKHLTERARFKPPLGRDGNPMQASGRAVIHWQTFSG